MLVDTGPIHITVEACNVARCPSNPEAAWVSVFQSVVNDFQGLLDDPAKAPEMSIDGSRQGTVPLVGLLVHDVTERARFAQWLTRFGDEVARKGLLSHTVGPTPLFVDSGLTNMVQRADLCAFAVHRYLQHQDDYLFNVLEPGLHHASHCGLTCGCQCRICGRNSD